VGCYVNIGTSLLSSAAGWCGGVDHAVVHIASANGHVSEMSGTDSVRHVRHIRCPRLL